jgi:hypothetical protein
MPAGRPKGQSRSRQAAVRHGLATRSVLGQRPPERLEAGWDSVLDTCPPWTRTLIATWSPPRLDLTSLRSNFPFAVLMAVGLGAVGLITLVADPAFAAIFLALAAVSASWAYLQWHRRSPQSTLTLELGPAVLRLSSDLLSTPVITLPRADAGWLQAWQWGLGRDTRRLALLDVRGETVAEFAGGVASVREEGGPGAASKVPVVQLMGSWWPHSAQRTTHYGAFEFPWRDPDIEWVSPHRDGGSH